MTIFRFDDFRLDTRDMVLFRRDQEVALTPKAVETLLALLRAAGSTLSKHELLDRVWPDQAVGDAVLTQNIYTLRAALRDAGGSPQLISTVPKRGYRINGDVAQDDHPSESMRVAVLPFRAHPPTEESVGLGHAVADSLIAHLGKQRVAVVRPGSSANGSNLGFDASALATELAVSGVVCGSIQRSGDRLRVRCEWLDEAGAVRWTDQFEGAAEEVFSLQDRLCDAVTSAMLPHTPAAAGSEVRSTDSETYRSYARGRVLWNQRSREALEQAIECFERVIQRDTTYAPAWAGLSDALVLAPFYRGDAPADVFPKAEEAAQQALALDPNLPEALTSIAYSQFIFRWDWSAARATFEQALDVNPAYANAHHWFGFQLAASGIFDRALYHAHRAVELDPLALVKNADLGFVHYFARDSVEAKLQFEHTLELNEDFSYARFGLSLALESEGDLSGALLAADRAQALAPESAAMRCCYGRALALAGNHDGARTVLDELDQLDAKAIHRAVVLCGLGDIAGALDSLEVAFQERSRFLVFIDVWPIYDPLREDPRFASLRRRILSADSLAS